MAWRKTRREQQESSEFGSGATYFRAALGTSEAESVPARPAAAPPTPEGAKELRSPHERMVMELGGEFVSSTEE